MRADAALNRERVLAEARRALADGDDSLRFNDLARRAGVGIGTVYRQFPTRQALLEAIVSAQLRELAELAQTLSRENDVSAALARFLHTALMAAVTQPALVDVLLATQDEGADITRAKCEIADAVSDLLGKARQHGVARTDLDGGDILTLLCGLQHAIANRPDPTAAAEHYLRVLLLGLGLPDRADG